MSEVKDEILFPEWTDALGSEVIGNALGAASSCWENLSSAGEFQADMALRVVEETLKEMRGRANRVHAIFSDLEDLYDKIVPEDDAQSDDHYDELVEKVIDPLREVICSLVGHQPVDDQCFNPEHRYCAMCRTLTPGVPTVNWVLK